VPKKASSSSAHKSSDDTIVVPLVTKFVAAAQKSLKSVARNDAFKRLHDFKQPLASPQAVIE
jgi:hypothetical protein